MDDNTRIVLEKLLDTILEFKSYIGTYIGVTTFSTTFKTEVMELIQLFASA